MNSRSASGRRRNPFILLTTNEIEFLKNEIKVINATVGAFRFNEGTRTGFSDDEGLIYIRNDIFPDITSTHPTDRMSERAVLAHEYYGHFLFSPSEFRIGDWRDEMRASYIAALVTPNLSDQDRAYLILDAYERAKEAGYYFKYSKKARDILYGYR